MTSRTTYPWEAAVQDNKSGLSMHLESVEESREELNQQKKPTATRSPDTNDLY